MSQLDVKFESDVALSFASEQRDYVKPLAIKLRNMGIRVFYDEFEEHNLWGKDLPEYLEEIYWKKSKYCAIFISNEYAKKSWTTHEKKNALARALEERAEYILPVRFDDTEIPGIRPTIGYIDARKTSTEDLAKIIKWKVSGKESHIVKNITTYTNHSLNFEIPNGWAVSSEKQINNTQMDGTSINDTQIILSEGPSVIRVDIIEIPQIKWLLKMYDDGPWYVTGVLESFYRNYIIEISIPKSLKGGSGIPVNPDGTKDMSFRTSALYQKF
jgi:hypothetical protein